MSERGAKIIHFRASDNELKSIRIIQKQLSDKSDKKIKPSISSAIRVALSEMAGVHIALDDSSEIRKMIDELERIRGILYRDGGNLNQIAHKINVTGNIDPSLSNQLATTQKALNEARSALQFLESD